MSSARGPLAGFPVTIIGRFWVTAEGMVSGEVRFLHFIMNRCFAYSEY
jgi:hypothetical protein